MTKITRSEAGILAAFCEYCGFDLESGKHYYSCPNCHVDFDYGIKENFWQKIMGYLLFAVIYGGCLYFLFRNMPALLYGGGGAGLVFMVSRLARTYFREQREQKEKREDYLKECKKSYEQYKVENKIKEGSDGE